MPATRPSAPLPVSLYRAAMIGPSSRDGILAHELGTITPATPGVPPGQTTPVHMTSAVMDGMPDELCHGHMLQNPFHAREINTSQHSDRNLMAVYQGHAPAPLPDAVMHDVC